VVLRAGLGAGVEVLLPTEPPVPVSVVLDGGLRWTVTAPLVGAIQDTITVDYSAGTLSIDTINTLLAGALLQVDLNAYVSARVNDRIICEYIWPGAHWQTGAAWEFSVPVSVAGGLGGVAASLGAIHSGPFPVEDILTCLQQPAPGLNCLGFKDLLDEYKDRGPIKGQKICARPLEEIPNAPPLVLPAFRHAFAYDPLTGNNYAIRTLKCGNAITT